MTDALPRLTVALTFDHDALSDGIRRGDGPVKLSHGEFGPRVGAPRLLALLAREGIASTWFDNTDAMRASAATEEYRLTREDEPNFVGGHLPFVITREHVLMEPPRLA